MSAVYSWFKDLEPSIIALAVVISINYWLKIIAGGVIQLIQRSPDATDEQRIINIMEDVSRIEQNINSFNDLSYALREIQSDIANVGKLLQKAIDDNSINQSSRDSDSYLIRNDIMNIALGVEEIARKIT